MRNELIERSDLSDPEKDKISDVLINSREVALQRYEHPIYDAEFGLGASGWHKLISRTPVQYTREQFAVFRAVHQWRDNVARVEDESPLFILPHHAVFSIARAMPGDKTALLSMIQHVSPILRTRADELIAVIGEARTGASDAPDLVETLEKIDKIRYPEGRATKLSKATVAFTQPSSAITPAPTIATLDTPPLRAPMSTFWGSLGSTGSVTQQRPMSTFTSGVSLALPLPLLTAEVFSEGPGSPLTKDTPKAERPEHSFVPKEERPAEDKRSDIFIVKQLGGKRKREDIEKQEEDAEPTSVPSQDVGGEGASDEIMLEDDEAERRKAAKEAKLLRKKERREQKALQQVSAGPDDEEPAFDYAAAPSVLRAHDADKGKSGSGKKKKDKRKSGGFNPYAKMTDAPKGLPRSQEEVVGRSKTFK
jgi:exosome complex exonuclease RRP6